MRRLCAAAASCVGLLTLLSSQAVAWKPAIDEREPPFRFTLGMLAGSGYGWANGNADVNADIPFLGGSWAGLGHLTAEAAMLFPRAHLFVSASIRTQVITGTRDVYAAGRVFHGRSGAVAFFQKIGWFPLTPDAPLQPYIAASTGLGNIAHRAELVGFRNCGSSQDQQCIDTVTLGPYFVGAGGGVRWRLNDRVDALLAVDAQLAFEGLDDRGYNIDANLGMAVVF